MSVGEKDDDVILNFDALEGQLKEVEEQAKVLRKKTKKLMEATEEKKASN